jgi:hypothetical protein
METDLRSRRTSARPRREGGRGCRHRRVQDRRRAAATPRKALRVRANDIAREICLVVGNLALTDIVGGRRPVRGWTYSGRPAIAERRGRSFGVLHEDEKPAEQQHDDQDRDARINQNSEKNGF